MRLRNCACGIDDAGREDVPQGAESALRGGIWLRDGTAETLRDREA
jgi:hypothetical protein